MMRVKLRLLSSTVALGNAMHEAMVELEMASEDMLYLQPPSGPCLENSELEEAVAAGVGCVGPALWVVGSRLSPSYLPGPLKKSSLAMGPFWAMHHPLPPSLPRLGARVSREVVWPLNLAWHCTCSKLRAHCTAAGILITCVR